MYGGGYTVPVSMFVQSGSTAPSKPYRSRGRGRQMFSTKAEIVFYRKDVG